jgi:peptide/nickel transport system ATP-binding protein
MSGSGSLLEVTGLSTRLGSPGNPVYAVDAVNFSLQRGKTLALLGESGCGKSMTALSLMRLLPSGGSITAGEVSLDGESLLALTEREMRDVRGGRMGMIFQEPMTSLNPVMTIGDQIAESVRLHDGNVRGKKQVGQRVVELLRDVGIPDPQRRQFEYPHQLSGGMKQRVMIAIALAGNPDVLIADEPTTALDVTIQAQILELILDLQKETGMAVLFITHALGVIAQICQDVAVMYAGWIVECAPAAALFKNPLHPYTQGLLASIPRLSSENKSILPVIRGAVPSLHQLPPGCRFQNRCPHVMDRCRKETPGPVAVDDDHWARCFLLER